MVNTPGQRLTSPVAHFRLDKREEVTIKWYMLSCDTIVIIIGKSTVITIALTLRTLLTIILGAIFQMWQVTRQRQMAQFTNMDAGREQGIGGHGLHSVTPEQVHIRFFI